MEQSKSWLLVAAVSISLWVGMTSVCNALSGDSNKDSKVDVFDALQVLQYSVGLYHPPDDVAAFELAADVAPLDTACKPKGDGKINIFDALAILRHAVGLDDWMGLLKPPMNLKGTPGDGALAFTWDTVCGATSYNLYYGMTHGVTDLNATGLIGVTSPKTVSGLTNGVPYYAIVTAINGDGQKTESSECSATPADTMIKGVAAAGMPIIGTVTLKDATNKELSTTPDVGGFFAFNVAGLTGPFLIKVQGTANGVSYILYSFASGPGTANVNPLTTVVVMNAAGVIDMGSLYTTVSMGALTAITTNLNKSVTDLHTALQQLLVIYKATSVNPITYDVTAVYQMFKDLFNAISVDIVSGAVTVRNRANQGVIFTSSIYNLSGGAMYPNNLPVVTVTVTPATVSLYAGETTAFTATVPVSWSVLDPVGTITSSGVYTAPALPGTYLVQASSLVNSTAIAYATVTVIAAQSKPPVKPALGNAVVTFMVNVPDGITLHGLQFPVNVPAGFSILKGVFMNLVTEGSLVGMGTATDANFINSMVSVDGRTVYIRLTSNKGFGSGDIVAMYCTLPSGASLNKLSVNAGNIVGFTNIFSQEKTRVTGLSVYPDYVTTQ